MNSSVSGEGVVKRLLPLDALRGFIMVVMALDHANSFIAHGHPSPEIWSRPLPRYPDAVSFLTRLVTHLAAPGFSFLMGVGVTLLAASRTSLGWSRLAISRYLVLRGLLLIALQFLVENPAWRIGETGSGGPVYVGVLFQLGGSLVLSPLLLWLPTWLLGGVSLAIILATQLIEPTRLTGPFTTWHYLAAIPGNNATVSVLYPILPWVGIFGLGLLFGRLVQADTRRAYRLAPRLGLAGLGLFVGLRLAAGFGNIRLIETPNWIGFLNVVKYPPSLVFDLLTLGTNLLWLGLLAWIATRGWGKRLVQPLVVFGQTPLLFYLTHLYLYGYLGLVIAPAGMSIPSMYPWWLVGLAVLYPLCWAYGRFKRGTPVDSLWRFL